MKPIEHFLFCPRCGQHRREGPPSQTFHCEHCGFVYYFNPAIAAAAFLVNPRQEALFIRRAKEPAKSKLALPGGFVDVGETAESALRREIREEVNLSVASLAYLCSQTNQYQYKDVTYAVLDLFFVVEPDATAPVAALDGVESYCWLKPSEVIPSELAFPSIREALAVYLRTVC